MIHFINCPTSIFIIVHDMIKIFEEIFYTFLIIYQMYFGRKVQSNISKAFKIYTKNCIAEI
jgi:hypothetical protein